MNLNENLDFSVPVERDELNITVDNLRQDILKLCNLTEKINASVEQDTVACDITDLSWLLKKKCNMIDKAIQTLKDSESNLLMTEGEIFVDLYNTLLKDNNTQIQITQDFSLQLQPLEENLAKIKENCNVIKLNQEIIDLYKIDEPEILNINLLDRISAAELKDLRNKLHSLLDINFKKANTKDLVQDLTIAYFKGGDNKYIEVSEKYPVTGIQMLKHYGLVSEDPYNKMRIKFVDFN